MFLYLLISMLLIFILYESSRRLYNEYLFNASTNKYTRVVIFSKIDIAEIKDNATNNITKKRSDLFFLIEYRNIINKQTNNPPILDVENIAIIQEKINIFLFLVSKYLLNVNIKSEQVRNIEKKRGSRNILVD